MSLDTNFAAALGLQKVGTAAPKRRRQQPIQIINSRGVPSRICKPTKVFEYEDIVKPAKRRRVAPSSATKSEVSDDKAVETSDSTVATLDRVGSQRNGLLLRNILQPRRAHKWVGYEFFNSYLDRRIFMSDKDFQNCLPDLFRAPASRQLTRSEWNKVRRLMGKPRRCSPAFFDEERRELERQRPKTRTRKSAKSKIVSDSPNEIPLPLPIGTKVTARVRRPQDGIFTGTIEAFDSLSSMYRITFESARLGTGSVPDFEVAANEFVTKDSRPENRKQDLSSDSKIDPTHESEMHNINSKSTTITKKPIVDFLLKLLDMVVRTNETIAAKQKKSVRLKSINDEAAILKSNGETIPDDFQLRYASTLMEVQELNSNLFNHLREIETFSRDLTKEPSITAMLTQSNQHEQETIDSMFSLLTELTTITSVASNLSNQNLSETKASSISTVERND